MEVRKINSTLFVSANDCLEFLITKAQELLDKKSYIGAISLTCFHSDLVHKIQGEVVVDTSLSVVPLTKTPNP